MNRASPRARRAAILAGGLVLSVAAVAALRHFGGPRATPPGQPPLVLVTPEALEGLRQEFNARAAQVRVIAFLSPT